jgi:hypothetical protein
MTALKHGAGVVTLTMDNVGTRCVAVLLGTFVDPNGPEDVNSGHVLQDQIIIKQASVATLGVPDLDVASLQATRERLKQFVPAIPDTSKAFGAEGQVDPVQHLVGAGFGWGGYPQRGAAYFACGHSRQLNLENSQKPTP